MQNNPEPQLPRSLTRHYRELLVHPLFWTSRHLDLLRCQFKDLGVAEAARPLPRRSPRFPTPEVIKKTADARRLAESRIPDLRLSSLVDVVNYADSPFKRPFEAPPFFFAGKPVHQPDYVLFCRRGQDAQPLNQEKQRAIGYFEYINVMHSRWKILEPPFSPGRGYNNVAGRLAHKQVSRITPTEWTEDPYLLCLLLTIAQFQKRASTSPQLSIYTPRLLVTKAWNFEFIYLFEAQVRSEILDMLENPTIPTIVSDSLTITRKKIPFQPYETFRERIVTEMLAPAPLDRCEAPQINHEDDFAFKRPVKRRCEELAGEKRITRQKLLMS